MKKNKELLCDLVEVGNACQRTLGYAGNYCESNQYSPCHALNDGCDDSKCG